MNFPLPGFDQLRTRLLYLLLVALLPACGLVLYGNLEQQRNEKEALRREAIASARLAAATQEHYVRNARHLLSTLTEFSFLTLATQRQFCETHFQNLRLISPDYDDFGLIEADGRLFCSATLTNGNPFLTNSSIYRQISQKPQFCISTLEADALGTAPSMRFAYPVFATNGEFKRIIYASIGLSLLSEALTNIALPPGSTITVVDRDSNVIARSPDPEKWVGENIRQAANVEEVLRQPELTFEGSSADNIRRLFATTTVKAEGIPVLIVAVGIPTTVLYAHANQVLARNSVVLLLVSFIAILGAWFFARQLFLRPLHRIVEAAQRLSKGDYSARTGLPPGRSELHQLAGHFDEMAENLARHEADLRAANEKISRLNAELEQRVIDRTAQLEATNRELEAFSYSVSHDLRAPLRHLDGFAQILSSEPGLQENERVQRYLQMITRSAKKMGLLIDDLLSFSRMGRKTMERRKIDFNELVRDVIAEFKEEQEGREIQWNISTLPTVSGDASMLRQVWTNLISNALKYSRDRKPAIIEIGHREEGDQLVFFVRDNGAGFEMKYADKLFGVFQRLHSEESFEGTGIGLANVRRIVSRHNGRTWAEGELDKGATFYFSLPKTPPAS